MGDPSDPATPPHVILLVHGIRTQAEWAESVRNLLESAPDTVVIPIRYGFFDSFRFLLPFKGLKSHKVKIVEQAIRDIPQRYPGAQLSILAHSFGCYIVGRVLEEEPDIRLHRLVLCGSVLRRNFPWVTMAEERHGKVVNECGWRDIWPVLAESITWGYGASGRFGFEGGTRVEDRFHDLAHSDFLTEDFAREYWLPFFRDGEVVQGDERPKTPVWVSLLGVFRLRYLIILALIAAGLWWVRSPSVPTPPDQVASEQTSETPSSGLATPIAEERPEEFFPHDPDLRWDPVQTSGDSEITDYEIRFNRSPDFGPEDTVTHKPGNRTHLPLNTVRLLPIEGEGPIRWSVRANLESGVQTEWSKTQSFILYNDVLDRIAQSKRLRVGVSSTQIDLFSCTDENGEWAGIDMDLVRRLIPFLEEELGVRLNPDFEVKTFDWGNPLVEAAVSRKVDFVVSSVTGTAERESDWGVKFTRHYFRAKQTIVSKPGRPIESLGALKGLRIGGPEGTTNWAYAKHWSPNGAKVYEGKGTIGQMVRDLENGQLDAFFLDEPFARMRNRTREKLDRPLLELTPLEPQELEDAGFPTPHSEDYAVLLHPAEARLKEVLDKGIDELEAQEVLDLLQLKARLDSPCLGT